MSRTTAYFMLLGATAGWVGSAIAIAWMGRFNIGTMLVPCILTPLWIWFFASMRSA